MGDCNSTNADEIKENYSDNAKFDVPKFISSFKCKYLGVEADEYLSYHCNHPKRKGKDCLWNECRILKD